MLFLINVCSLGVNGFNGRLVNSHKTGKENSIERFVLQHSDIFIKRSSYEVIANGCDYL